VRRVGQWGVILVIMVVVMVVMVFGVMLEIEYRLTGVVFFLVGGSLCTDGGNNGGIEGW